MRIISRDLWELSETSIRYFKHFLEGQIFKVVTDQKPLVYAFCNTLRRLLPDTTGNYFTSHNLLQKSNLSLVQTMLLRILQQELNRFVYLLWENFFGILGILPFIFISQEKLFAYIYCQFCVNAFFIFFITPLMLVRGFLIALFASTIFGQRCIAIFLYGVNLVSIANSQKSRVITILLLLNFRCLMGDSSTYTLTSWVRSPTAMVTGIVLR